MSPKNKNLQNAVGYKSKKVIFKYSWIKMKMVIINNRMTLNFKIKSKLEYESKLKFIAYVIDDK